MKKILSLTVASLFLLSATGWNFSSKDLNGMNANKSTKSTISCADNTKLVSYASTSTQASMNAPKAKKPAKKVIHKTTTVTKKTIHKKGNTTTTTITTKTTKHK